MDKSESVMLVEEKGGIEEEIPMELEEEAGKMVFPDDDSSPRGVLETPALGTDSDTSSSSSSCSSSSSEKSVLHLAQQALVRDSIGMQWKTMVDVLKKRSVKKFSTLPLLATYELSRKNIRRRFSRIRSAEDTVESGGFPVPKPSWRSFEYSELVAATDNFNSERLIGKGGHAEVYKGCLSDGQVVAVKKLVNNDDDKEEEDRIGDFLTELGIIAHVNHPNAARLLGFSIEGGLHLVLQFLPQGSLANVLHGSVEGPEWKRRFKMAVGIAEGLKYLHHDCPRRIIHRDIKASNILLTDDYEAQISDFGLAKWLPEKWTHHVIFPIEGTFGYLAPEYFMHGIVDEKTDIFAFGVLLLEIITGRHAVDSCRQSLVMWAKPLLDSNNADELVDPRLGAYDPTEMKCAMTTASSCIEHSPEKRPSMERVLQLLKGEEDPLEAKYKPKNRRRAVSSLGLPDHHKDELSRHRQLALE